MDVGVIGVISDTHGSLPAWTRAWKCWGDPDLVIHGGDVLYHGPRNPLPEGYSPAELAEAMNQSPVPVLISKGNCDADVDGMVLQWPVGSSQVILWWEGRLILVEHGEDFSSFRDRALRCKASLAISGHTHVASIVREGKTIFLNPGSASLPKGKDPASVALLDREGITILTLDGAVLHREKWQPR